jgi:hypothetical protein
MDRHGLAALLAPLLLLALLGALLAGCAGEAARQGPGGMPALQAARISLVVAQTRAQFPELSGGAIPFEPRKPPAATPGSAPELALRGSGVGVQPGP